jgi:flagellar export protein FliJ
MDSARLEALRKYRLWQKKQAEEGLEKSRREMESARKRFADALSGRDGGLEALEEKPDSLAWKDLCYRYLAWQDRKMADARQDVSASEQSFREKNLHWTATRCEVEKIDVLIGKEEKIQRRIGTYREERRMEEVHSRNSGSAPGKKK